MSPLRVTLNGNGLIGIATPRRQGVGLQNIGIDETVFWLEGDNIASVRRGETEFVREFPLPRVGDTARWETEVYVAPIEKGEPTTLVKRTICIERVDESMPIRSRK